MLYWASSLPDTTSKTITDPVLAWCPPLADLGRRSTRPERINNMSAGRPVKTEFMYHHEMCLHNFHSTCVKCRYCCAFLLKSAGQSPFWTSEPLFNQAIFLCTPKNYSRKNPSRIQKLKSKISSKKLQHKSSSFPDFVSQSFVFFKSELKIFNFSLR